MGYLMKILEENKARYAGLITQEMGKPIAMAEGEINKCITHLQYYIDTAERHLEDDHLTLMNPNHTGYITH